MLEDIARDLEANGTPLPDGAIDELEASAKSLVLLYLGRHPPVRPSAIARELKVMANALERAARAAESRNRWKRQRAVSCGCICPGKVEVSVVR